MRMIRLQWKNVLALAFLMLCLGISGYYLTAGYGAYLDSDMASELTLAQHLAETGRLISRDWRYSTEVRVLNTQLVFTPLMALFGDDWQLVRALGCMILLAMLAGSAVFCGRRLGAKGWLALMFAGLSVLPLSLVYAQMVVIGAYYIPHAILTNLLVGLAAGMEERKGRLPRCAVLLLLAAVMGASSIRYLLCASLPMAAAGVWLSIFGSGGGYSFRRTRELPLTAASLAAAAASGAGYVIGQRLFSALFEWDGARYAGSRLTGVTGSNIFELLDQALDGLMRLTGYMEGRVLLSVQGLLSVGALGLIVLGGWLCARALKAADGGAARMRFGVLTLVMSAALTLFTFLFVDGLYLNRYWIPVMTLGAPVMAACLTGEKNAAFRALAAAAFACVVLGLSAAQVKNSMANPEIGENERRNAQAVRECGMDFGYATFWHANVMTELTDGAIEMVGMNLEKNGQGEAYPAWISWLETVENAGMNRAEEPVFILLDAQEAQKLEAFLALCDAQEREMPADGLKMYVVSSQKAYFDAASEMAEK